MYKSAWERVQVYTDIGLNRAKSMSSILQGCFVWTRNSIIFMLFLSQISYWSQKFPSRTLCTVHYGKKDPYINQPWSHALSHRQCDDGSCRLISKLDHEIKQLEFAKKILCPETCSVGKLCFQAVFKPQFKYKWQFGELQLYVDMRAYYGT